MSEQAGSLIELLLSWRSYVAEKINSQLLVKFDPRAFTITWLTQEEIEGSGV